MKNLPVKVSVIIPVYNVEKCLSTCLTSCINQTLYDVEFICVNDGSTDNSLAILEKFAQVDNRIKIVNKPNGGLSSARNAGIREANGEIIMFLDSDDYLALNACERVWIENLEAPTDVVIFGTHIFPEKPRASDWHYWILGVRTHRRWEFTPDVLFNETGAKPFVWRQAYNRKFFTEYGLSFDETVKYGEDMVFQLQALPHGKNFAFISDELYYYRWCREGSLMASVRDDMDEKLRKHLGFVETICKYWKEQDWLEKYGKEYTKWLLEFLVCDIRSPEVQCAQEHLQNLNQLLQEYDLAKYLDKMPERIKLLVNTVKKGTV
ncbi:MAG: glycosyltransferase family 2 protein [Oscillospiraceae bacterium]|nr:glycosyltransferase family 2 protein [Oscillospiraceae bacterium]